MGHTALGKDLTPRIAANLQGGLVSDVIKIEIIDNEIVFTRPIYSGKAFEKKTVQGRSYGNCDEAALHFLPLLAQRRGAPLQIGDGGIILGLDRGLAGSNGVAHRLNLALRRGELGVGVAEREIEPGKLAQRLVFVALRGDDFVAVAEIVDFLALVGDLHVQGCDLVADLGELVGGSVLVGARDMLAIDCGHHVHQARQETRCIVPSALNVTTCVPPTGRRQHALHRADRIVAKPAAHCLLHQALDRLAEQWPAGQDLHFRQERRGVLTSPVGDDGAWDRAPHR